MNTGLLKSRKLAGGLGLLLALILVLSLAIPVVGDTTSPMKFYGTVEVCGEWAPEGTVVQAKVGTTGVGTGVVNGVGSYGLIEIEGTHSGEQVELWVADKMYHSEAWTATASRPVDLDVDPTLIVSHGGTGAGTTTPGVGTSYYTCDELVVLTATPDGTSDFTGWTGNITAIDNPSLMSTNITMDSIYSITANFAPAGTAEYTLHINASTNGEVTDPGEDADFGPYASGTVVDLMAVADECYEFDEWTGDTGTIADDIASTNITMNGDYTIEALFSIKQYTLHINQSTNGEVTVPGEDADFGPYDCGTVVDLTAVADECYEFDEWTGDTGTIADDIASTNITMNGDYTIEALFSIKQYSLTTASGTGGSVTVPGEGTFGPYDCGTDVTITASPATDYEFNVWTGDNTTIADTKAASTTIDMTGAYSITATFTYTGSAETYTLHINQSTNGEVTDPGEDDDFGPYAAGTEVDLMAVADECYEFDEWTGDTGDIASVGDADTSITMNGDYTIEALFSIKQYTLHINQSTNGEVTVPGEDADFGPYDCGTDVTITAVADGGYQFDEWTGDTGDIANVGNASTTITMNGDYTIEATFEPEKFDLIISSTEGGSVTTPGEGTFADYENGTLVPLVAEAVGCYNFVEWTGGPVDNPALASTNITMNGNYSIVANFELAAELEDIEIPFAEDWNTFSTPIALHDCVDTWEEFIAANSLVIEMIYGYDSVNGWVTVNDPDKIKPLYGFYVKASEAGVAHIIPNSEETPLPSRELSAGISLIGAAPITLADYPVEDALSTIYEGSDNLTGYSLVVSPYVNTSGSGSWAYTRDSSTSYDVNIGRAYWVVMQNPGLYVGETNTPRP